jgi:hypothetical protein
VLVLVLVSGSDTIYRFFKLRVLNTSFSLGRGTTAREVDAALRCLVDTFHPFDALSACSGQAHSTRARFELVENFSLLKAGPSPVLSLPLGVWLHFV